MTLDPRWIVRDPGRPVFSLCLAFPEGARTDPPGRAGLSHLTALLTQGGAGDLPRKAFIEAVDRYGASLDVSVSRHHTLLWIDGLSRHLEPLVELAALALQAPRHDAVELDRARRELITELDEVRDDDAALGARAFAQALYGTVHPAGSGQAHPYARPLKGTAETLGAISREEIAQRHAELFCGLGQGGVGGPDGTRPVGTLLAGLAGDADAEALARAVSRIVPAPRADLAGLARPAIPAPLRRPGVHLVLVDKPERAQTQLFIGQPTIPLHHPDWTALQLAQTAFGGIFTSTLSQEIRERRGWSYSVWSSLQGDPFLGTFQIRLHPNNADLIPALETTLGLLSDFVARGPDPAGFLAARDNLARGHVFAIDTATRLLWERLSTELAGLPRAWLDDAVARYRGVSLEAATAAAAAHLDARDLTVVVVGTAREVAGPLSRLPGLASFEVRDWTFEVRDPTA
jgi:zinc protease